MCHIFTSNLINFQINRVLYYVLDLMKTTFQEISFCTETLCSTKRYVFTIGLMNALPIGCTSLVFRHIKTFIFDVILQVQTKHRICHSLYSFPHCTCAVSIQSGQDVFLVDVCGEREFIDFLSCNDSVLKIHQIHDKLYKVFLDIVLKNVQIF